MQINKNGISNGVKTKNLVIIFILFLLITLASASVVFLTKEKSQPVTSEQPSVIEKPVEAVADEPAKVESLAPKPNTTPLIREDKKVEAPEMVNKLAEEKIRVVMIIDGARYEVAIKPDSSAYDAMNLLKNENKINFSGKNYSSLGFFVEEINGVKNNPSGENWLYYVNGQPAQVGVSYYLIKENDVIEWKYENKSF